MKFKKFFKRFIGACALAFACVLSCSVKTHAYYYDNVTGNMVSSNLYQSLNLYEYLTPGVEYTISFNQNISHIKIANSLFSGQSGIDYLTEKANSNFITFTMGDFGELKLILFGNDYIQYSDYSQFDVMLVKGSSSLPYEPYGQTWYSQEYINQNYSNYYFQNNVNVENFVLNGSTPSASFDEPVIYDKNSLIFSGNLLAYNFEYLNYQDYSLVADISFKSIIEASSQTLKFGFNEVASVEYYLDNDLVASTFGRSSSGDNANGVVYLNDVSFNRIIVHIDYVFSDYSSRASLSISVINNYYTGYENGYKQGSEDGYIRGVNDTADNKYNEGYSVGYQDAKVKYDGTDNSLGNMILTIADTPVHLFRSIFNFDILGVNIYGFISSLATLLICVWVVKKVI